MSRRHREDPRVSARGDAAIQRRRPRPGSLGLRSRWRPSHRGVRLGGM